MTELFRALDPTRWAILAGVVLLIMTAVLWFGQSRYRAGVEATDAKWEAAGKKLADQARTSADAATRREAPRIAAHAAEVAVEKEKIDEALAEGRSPFDVLFPAAGGVQPD